MAMRLFAAVLTCAITSMHASADMMFAEFFEFEPVTRFDFGYCASAPETRVTFLRSRPGEYFTDISLEIADPAFKIVGHTCPSTLSQGKSCIVFISFDPDDPSLPDSEAANVFKATLAANSNEGVTRLQLSAHSNKRHCEEQGLPLTSVCTTP